MRLDSTYLIHRMYNNIIHLLTTIIPSGPELWTDAPNHCLDLSSITTPDALLFPEIAERNKDFNSSKMVPFKTLLLRANKENKRQNAFFMCLLLSNLFCCRKNMYLSLLLLLDNAEIQNLCFCICNYKLFSWGFKLFVFLVLVK